MKENNSANETCFFTKAMYDTRYLYANTILMFIQLSILQITESKTVLALVSAVNVTIIIYLINCVRHFIDVHKWKVISLNFYINEKNNNIELAVRYKKEDDDEIRVTVINKIKELVIDDESMDIPVNMICYECFSNTFLIHEKIIEVLYKAIDENDNDEEKEEI